MKHIFLSQALSLTSSFIKQSLVFGLLASISLGMATTATHAEQVASSDNNKIAIDMSDIAATKNEIAVLQVLSEICPPMLNKNQQQGFSNAYNIELKKLMPSLSNPKQALQYLSTQQDYKQILADTRQWTLSYPKTENKAICNDLATYHY